MAKRILFISYTADWTGPTNSLWLLLKHLRRRYEVAVLVRGEGFFTETLAREDIPFFRVGSLGKEAIPGVCRLIRREHFDLVYGNRVSGDSRNAFIAAKVQGVPFVCHIREIGWEKTWRKAGFLRFADAVIAVSRASAASYARFVQKQRLHVVHNGVPLDGDSMPRDDARAYLQAEVDLSPEDVVLVNVSHVCRRKGQEHALRAMTDVVKEIPPARLLLMGSLDREAAYVDKVRHMIKGLKLDRHVSILGFRRDALRLIQGAQLALHTALEDPHPRSVIECMHAGLPVVAFGVDGVAETIVDGETGYLLRPGDDAGLARAIVKLVRDPALQAHFGRAGRQRVREHFSAQATADGVARVIDAVLQ